jgi:hypothetical protein
VISDDDGDVIGQPSTFGVHDHVPDQVGLGNVDNTQQIPLAEKGQPNGVASLNSGGKIPNSQLDIAGALEYQGVWDASENLPMLSSGVGTTNHWYKVGVAGSQPVDGITEWGIGDQILFNGTSWEKIDNTDDVISVAGKQGVVSLVKSDVGLGNVDNVQQVPLSVKGQPNGVAELGANGKVPAEQLTLDSGNVYGARKLYGEVLGDAFTDSEEWQEKVEIETPADWPGGLVKLEWCCSWSISNSFGDARLRIRQSGQALETRGEMQQSPSSSESDQNIPFSGFKVFHLAAGVHTFTFQYSTHQPYFGSATVRVWDACVLLKLLEVD